MVRSRRWGWCLLVVALFLACTRNALALRIAVVGDGGEAAARTMDLVQAQMAGDAGVQFVERQAIRKILDEQKLSLSGAVSAQQAVQAGKILGADLLAVVEKQEDAAGVVVFDARTGVRLCDQALGATDEKAAAGLAEALRESVRKAGLGPEKRRPICLLTVRNVDLPKADDAFCQAVARLTERRLLASPDVVLLERERLNELRKERELAPADPRTDALMAAVTLLELQVAKDDTGGIRATCVLSDNQGKRSGNPATAVTKSRQANELAASLAGELAKVLQVGAPAVAEDAAARKAEAARFYREAQFWWGHRDYDRPIPALEAAMALDPDNPLLRSQFAWGLALAGMTRIQWGVGDQMPMTTRDEAPVQAILKPRVAAGDITESLQLVAAATKRLFLDESLRSTPESDKIKISTMKLVVVYLKGLQAAQNPPTVTTAEQMQSVCDIRKDYFALQRLRAGAPRLEDARDWDGAVRATAALQDMLMDPDFYATASRQEVLQEIAESMAAWRAMCKRAPPTGSPCIRGIGELLDHERLRRALRRDSVPADKTLAPRDPESFLAIYDALGGINDATCRATAEAGKTWINETVAKEGLKPERASRGIPHPAPRLLTAARGGTPIAADATTAPAKSAYWKDCRLLLDFSTSKPGEGRKFSKPIVYQNSVYALDVTRTDFAHGKYSGKLLKIDLLHLPKDLPSVSRGKLSYAGDDEGFLGDASSIAEGYYIHLHGVDAPVELFPLDGSAHVVLDGARGFDFPDPDAAAILGGKLYAAGNHEQGLLIEYDLAKHTIKTLAASKRTEIRSPFDNQPPMRIPFILPDGARDRIVFSAGAPGWSKELAGLWEYNVKTERFKALWHPDRDLPPATAFEHRGVTPPVPMVFDDRAVLGQKILDLRSNKLSDAPHVKIVGSGNGSTTILGPGFSEHFAWTSWGRARIPDGPMQRFAAWADESDLIRHSWRIIPIDDNRCIAYDHTTLWLLSPPETESAPEPPRVTGRTVKLPPPIVPPEGGELPWNSVHVVYDHIRDLEKTEMYLSPRVVGEGIFVLGVGHDLPKELRPRGGRQEDMTVGFAQLLRYPRDGATVKALGKLPITGVQDELRPDQRFTNAHRQIAVAVDEHNYYAAMSGEPSILVFPLDGSPARKIAIDAPPTHLAVLDGQLYAAWQYPRQRDGYRVLSRVDPVTGKAETLLSTEKEVTAWQGSYHPPIHNLWADAARHRLLYLAQGPRPDPKADGLWELSSVTGQRRLVLPFFIEDRSQESFTNSAIYWTGSNADGSILIRNRRGLFVFDPAADRASVVMQHHPDFDPLAKAPNDPVSPHAPISKNYLLNGGIYDLPPPNVLQNGYVWYAFGRVSLDGKQYEKFPALRSFPGDVSSGFFPADLQFLDVGRQLLVSDCYSAWILDLRK